MRGHAGEVEHVLVLTTLGAQERRWLRRPRARRADPAPAPVSTTRVTLIAASAFDDGRAAERWLGEATADRECGAARAGAAVTTLNRILHLHRAATADPHVREVDVDQALVVRVGIGEGEQVAAGHWVRATELPLPRRARGRTAALRPQERLAALLSARDAALACEELALRARQDVDAGRRREAALQLEAALTMAMAELEPWAPRGDLAGRLAELRGILPAVQSAAQAALQGGVDDADEAAVRHALERLEAALRARTVLGFD
ncbi:MAG TPA: hypothetical protein VF257_07485 [Solirubrobacteraceae bacterium]